MRRFRCDGSGRLAGVRAEEASVPEPGYGQIRVRIETASLNYLDLKIIAGDFPGGKAGLVPLSDGAGVVDALGAGVTAWKKGDRVVSLFFPKWFAGPITDAARGDIPGATRDGMLQDYVLFDEAAVAPVPQGIDAVAAATLPCAALTAWQIFTGPRAVLPGETVLVQGSGGVSLFALQFARLAGARVIATSSSSKKAERLRAMGAEAVIDYGSMPGWGVEVKRLTADAGADHILEIGEAGTLEQCIAAAAVGAQINLVGRPVDAPPVDPAILMAAMATYRRISVGSRADFLAMTRAIEAHGLVPVIDRVFGPDQVEEALAYFAARGHFGKVVIRMV